MASESPWSHLLGTISWAGIEPFSPKLLAINVLMISLGLCLALYLLRSISPVRLFLCFLCAFNVASLVRVSDSIDRHVKESRRAVQPLLDAVPITVEPGSRLYVAGVAQGIGSGGPIDSFGDLNRVAGLRWDNVFRLEILRRLDLRIVQTQQELESLPVGALLLTVSELPEQELISMNGGFRVYRISKAPSEFQPASEREVITPNEFFSVGGIKSSSSIVGRGSGEMTYLVYGPYEVFPPGRYRAHFRTKAPGKLSYIYDVVQSTGKVLASARSTGAQAAPLEFIATGRAALEFRVFGADAEDFWFGGVVLERDSGNWDAIAPSDTVTLVPSIFASEVGTTLPDGTIAGGPAGRHGFLVFGPYVRLPRGQYQATFQTQIPNGLSLRGEVVVGAHVACQGTIFTGSSFACTFRTSGAETAEFRLHGSTDPGFKFTGVKLQLLSSAP